MEVPDHEHDYADRYYTQCSLEHLRSDLLKLQADIDVINRTLYNLSSAIDSIDHNQED